MRLTVSVDNEHPGTAADKDDAIRSSLIGAHVLLQAHGARVRLAARTSAEAAGAAGRCQQRRCWPVLAGAPGSTDIVLGAPIILYDYPEVAEQSAGALFDSTEIDEILTLRVMTMTQEEKAEARATDPRAREIIDRCDAHVGRRPAAAARRAARSARASAVTVPGGGPPAAPAEPMRLTDVHDAEPLDDLRNAEPPGFDTGGAPWWDPAADAGFRRPRRRGDRRGPRRQGQSRTRASRPAAPTRRTSSSPTRWPG